MSPVERTLNDEVRGFLASSRRAHLATTSAAGEPHVVPVCFALLDDDVLVFAVDDKPKMAGRKLKRLRNLEANPRYALVVDRWDEDWARLAYVLISGRAEMLADGARRAAAIAALRARYPQYVEMGLDASRHEVVALLVERVHAWGRLA